MFGLQIRAWWSLIALISLGFGSIGLLGGCGAAGDGTVISCAGSYSGTFTGDNSGNVTATLGLEGLLTTTFVSGRAERFMAMVDAAGAIATSSGAIQLSGMMNLDNCVAQGGWTLDTQSGQWEIEKF